MTPPDSPDNGWPNTEGIYYAPLAKAGFFRRLLASGVDALLLFELWYVIFAVWVLAGYQRGVPSEGALLAWLLGVFLYLGPLKRSTFRTPGYLVAGVRIVNFRGGRPSLLAMALRCGFALPWSGLTFLDLLWFLVTGRRQKLSDDRARTYVVRVGAEPVGRGPIVAAYYAAFGYLIVFGEVVPRPARSSSAVKESAGDDPDQAERTTRRDPRPPLLEMS